MSLHVIINPILQAKIKLAYFLFFPLFPFLQRHSKGLTGVGRERDTRPWMPVMKVHGDVNTVAAACREMTNTLHSPWVPLTLAMLHLSSTT